MSGQTQQPPAPTPIVVTEALRLPEEPLTPLSHDERKLVADGNTFAVDLYRRLDKQAGNLCFSSAGVSTLLTMTYAGARGETAAQLARVLHLDLPPEPAVVTISFDIDETGHPVHFQIEKPTQPVWGKQAIAIVKGWRFSPARSNGNAISVACTVDLGWGDKHFTKESLLRAERELQTARLVL